MKLSSVLNRDLIFPSLEAEDRGSLYRTIVDQAVATEKIHKTTAAMIGAALMLLVVLHGPKHVEPGAKRSSSGGVQQATTERTIIENDVIARSVKYEKLDVYSRYVIGRYSLFCR